MPTTNRRAPRPRRPIGRATVAALAVTLLAGATACTGRAADRAEPAAATTRPPPDTSLAPIGTLPPLSPDRDLPPLTVELLRPVYDGAIAPLDVRLTRAALIDLSADPPAPSATGEHLALYVEPNRAFTPDEYVDVFWRLSALLSPDVFERYPGLASFDICIERTVDEPDHPVGEAITQILVERAAVDAVDWRSGSLADLIAASRTGPGLQVNWQHPAATAPSRLAAEAAADARVGPPRASAGNAPIPTLVEPYGP